METSLRPRVFAALAGDIRSQPGVRTKYGLLFATLGQSLPLLEVYNANLHGLAKIANAAQVADPSWQRWRERFYQNPPAFAARSRRVAARLRLLSGQVDVVLQEGTLFDARWGGVGPPSVVFTDYTAALAARKPEAGRSPYSEQERQALMRLEKQAMARAQHICTRARFVRDSVIRDYGIEPKRVTAVGGGVNLQPLPSPWERPASNPPTALFVGKDFYRKGGDLLLRAFARARSEVADARLLLLTAGRIPADLPLAGVQVCAPTWNRPTIEGLFRQADLFVLPSRLETWGDVLLEAMAFGLPCLGVRGEAMAEVIVDGATGLLSQPDDVDDLARALVRLLQNPTLCLALGSAGRRRVAEHFTWQAVVDRLTPIITAAASGLPVSDPADAVSGGGGQVW
jgi:glycosyltransferase involved in cell wall biosynthesis